MEGKYKGRIEMDVFKSPLGDWYGILTEGRCLPAADNERVSHNIVFKLVNIEVDGHPSMLMIRLGRDEGIVQFDKKGSCFTARGANWTNMSVPPLSCHPLKDGNIKTGY